MSRFVHISQLWELSESQSARQFSALLNYFTPDSIESIQNISTDGKVKKNEGINNIHLLPNIPNPALDKYKVIFHLKLSNLSSQILSIFSWAHVV